jgi:hypothetical protein
VVVSSAPDQPTNRSAKQSTSGRGFCKIVLVPDAWSREEVEATVVDYFAMLSRELHGEPFNKAEHNRGLRRVLNKRSHGAVERKHQNISAILIEAGYPYIDGYKPLGNYQELLQTVVLDRLAIATDLNTEVAKAVTEPALEIPHLEDLLAIQVQPPTAETKSLRVRDQPLIRRDSAPRNYLELEARNHSLGRAGELLALRFERERLLHVGAAKLGANIRHVSEIEGDYLGYDILSFEADGRTRLIEVKTTRFGALTPFFASRNEVDISQRRAGEYQLYRVFAFGPRPRLFTLLGSLRTSCRLDPYTYEAIPG